MEPTTKPSAIKGKHSTQYVRLTCACVSIVSIDDTNSSSELITKTLLHCLLYMHHRKFDEFFSPAPSLDFDDNMSVSRSQQQHHIAATTATASKRVIH